MRTRLLLAPALALLVAVVAVVACGGGGATPGPVTPETTAGGGDDAAALNKKKCGGCHAPFDPGMHTTAQLEPIMKKHKDEKRVALSDGDWQKLTDYLAKR